MPTEMGEYLVGACLKLIHKCDFVEYNVRRPGGKIAGLNELDALGLSFSDKTAYLCEVTTHIQGLLIKNKEYTVAKIKKKYSNLQIYAENCLSEFPNRKYMFWSPVVGKPIESGLRDIQGLELIINQEYTDYMSQLENLAIELPYDTGNPAFRVLQILGHLKVS